MTSELSLPTSTRAYSYARNPNFADLRKMELMSKSSDIPLYEASPEPMPSHPSGSKSHLFKTLFGLIILLLVGCASASIIPEEDLSPPPALGAEAAKPDLVGPAQAIP